MKKDLDDALKEEYDVIYENNARKIDLQIQNIIGALDSKANIFLLTMGILASAYTLILSNSLSSFRNYHHFIIIEVTVFAIIMVLVLNACLLGRKETWYDSPSPDYILRKNEKDYKKGIVSLKYDLSYSMAEAYINNDNLVSKKYNLLTIAKYFLYLEGIVFIIHFFLSVFGVSTIQLLHFIF